MALRNGYAVRVQRPWVARLLPPESAPIEAVARELSISVTTLERWRAQALSMPARERAWTAA
ncbi:MAG: hypothetical protein L6Q55_06895, partial [Azonexus sp.]